MNVSLRILLVISRCRQERRASTTTFTYIEPEQQRYTAYLIQYLQSTHHFKSRSIGYSITVGEVQPRESICFVTACAALSEPVLKKRRGCSHHRVCEQTYIREAMFEHDLLVFVRFGPWKKMTLKVQGYCLL
jgi:hypothetical protein